MIGDRDAVRVPRQIVQHVTRAAERGLGVDDPVVAKERAKPRAKARSSVRRWRSPGSVSVPASKRVPRPATTLPRNTRLRTLTGRKKDGRACTHRVPSGERPPAGTTQCTCGWCSSVCPQVWRTLRKPSAAPRCFGVRGDLEERRRTRLEEQVVHHPFVLQREPARAVRQGEDDVGVPDRQQFAFTLGEPLVARVRQALRAVPIATRVERDGAMAAARHTDRDARPRPRSGSARWRGARAGAAR